MASCEKDFAIIKQLNQFIDPETFIQSVNRLISNADSKTAERLTALYPIRFREISSPQYLYYKKMVKEFEDCTIPLMYEKIDNTIPLKNYIVYGESFKNRGNQRQLFYNTYRASSKRNAFYKELGSKLCKTNENCTKMKLIYSSPSVFSEIYFRIKEFQEGTVDLNQLADKYFDKKGKRLLDGIFLTMKTTYDTDENCFKSIIYENGKIIGKAYDFKIDRLIPYEIDKASLSILLLYYIGFTPRQF